MWLRKHFVLAVAAQFFYVAAQTGIFSYFVNYIVSDTPNLPEGLAKALPAKMVALKDGAYSVTDAGASVLLSFGGFGLFLLGRFVGSGVLRVCKAHSTLALFCVANVIMMVLVMFPLGWFSVFGLFMSFFFMSIMFPTIFALGIRGLGEQTKKAASFIVMAIVGGAIMPLLMGWLADKWGMRVGFLMPLLCFVLIAAYAAFWPALESQDSGHEVAD
jgi:FHS family L-fucose permease-like MFS transporter